MSSTNKTPNLDLSQFVDADKPTWRGDYNGDMLKIDAGVKEVADSVTSLATTVSEGFTNRYTKTEIDTRLNTFETELTTEFNTTYVTQAEIDDAGYAKTVDVAPASHDHPTSDITGFTAAVESAVDAAIAELPDAASATVAFGTYAGRPAPAGIAAGSVYVATDVPESYYHNGVEWRPYGAGGAEIAYAAITSQQLGPTTAGEWGDIPGLSVTFKVGERPVEFSFNGDISNTVAGGVSIVRILLDGVTSLVAPSFSIPFATAFPTLSRSVRVANLTPGSTHTAKIQVAAANGSSGTGRVVVNGAAGNPAELSVVTR